MIKLEKVGNQLMKPHLMKAKNDLRYSTSDCIKILLTKHKKNTMLHHDMIYLQYIMQPHMVAYTHVFIATI